MDWSVRVLEGVAVIEEDLGLQVFRLLLLEECDAQLSHSRAFMRWLHLHLILKVEERDETGRGKWMIPHRCIWARQSPLSRAQMIRWIVQMDVDAVPLLIAFTLSLISSLASQNESDVLAICRGARRWTVRMATYQLIWMKRRRRKYVRCCTRIAVISLSPPLHSCYHFDEEDCWRCQRRSLTSSSLSLWLIPLRLDCVEVATALSYLVIEAACPSHRLCSSKNGVMRMNEELCYCLPFHGVTFIEGIGGEDRLLVHRALNPVGGGGIL